MPTLFRQYSIEYLYYSIDYFSKTQNKKEHLSSETAPEFRLTPCYARLFHTFFAMTLSIDHLPPPLIMRAIAMAMTRI